MINKFIIACTALVLSFSYTFAAPKVAHYPIGQYCWDESGIPANDTTTTVARSEDMWVIDDPANNVVVTLVPAPEEIKPEEYKGQPGWCLVKMEQRGEAL